MSDFARLKSLIELKYIKSQSALQEIAREEARLRQEIDKLRAHSADVDAQGIGTMSSLGADILWRAWVERALTQLNIELAQILARKEMYLAEARKAFSRMNISQEIADSQSAETLKIRTNARLEEAIETDLKMRGKPGPD